MVKEGIVLGHKISKLGIEVDKANVDVIAKLPHPTTVKETPFIFSKECIEALTQAPILVAPDWDLPFEIMCDASDFAFGAVLGQRKTKHFQPIHYASKTMTEAQAHYTMTDSRLENPHQSELEKKEITETFPLETFRMVTFRGDDNAPWFAHFANYHARNFVMNLMSLSVKEQKSRCRPRVVFRGKKLLTFSKLATVDPPGDTTVPITPLKRSSIQDFIGPRSTRMPTTLSPDVTFVNVKAKFHNVMRCHKTLSKFAKSLTCGALILWGRSRLQEGTKFIRGRDYLSKWVEAKALPTNNARVVCKFLKSLFARFGAPRAIISDRGTHFCNDQFTKVMLNIGTVGENRASWSDKLDDALWAFRTAYKTPIGCTPYKLVYGKACHLPIELEHKAYWALKHTNFDIKTAGDHRKVQLNELNELRDHAYENSLIYKEKTKRIHDSKIKNRVFNVGDQVLLFNSRLKIFSGKLKSRWSGPFTVTQVFLYGTVELSQNSGPNFKVNGHRLKHYF
ncbi:reverse transcriptase domain-containing protein [Tanacetum coccineum]|uniref:Reverse transcriptase domain-containing protein n=1 Tax=Tanacetum coccineum TaxID=301880 RepID=A0ABQ5GCU0_9ASTR